MASLVALCLLWQTHRFGIESKHNLLDSITQRYDKGVPQSIRSHDVAIDREGILIHNNRTAFSGANDFVKTS